MTGRPLEETAGGTHVGTRRAARFLAPLRWVVGLGAVAYLVLYQDVRLSALGGLLRHWGWSLAAVATLFGTLAATSQRLCVLFAPRGFQLSLGASMRLTLIGTFFNTFLPGSGGGDLVRLYYGARGHGGQRTEIVTVMLFDRIVGMFGLILWPLLAAPLFWSWWQGDPRLIGLLSAGLAVVVLMAVGAAVSWSRLTAETGWLARLCRRLPAGGTAWRVIRTMAAYRADRRAVGAAVVWALVAHTLAIATILIVAYVTVPEGGVTWMLVILIPMGFMANTIPLTPGGLGVGEAVFDTLFRLAGVDGGAEVLLGWRILSLALGLGGLVVYLRGRTQFVKTGPEVSVDTGTGQA